MKFVRIMLFIIFICSLMIRCINDEKKLGYTRIEFYSLDSTQTQSDKIQYDLANVFYLDSVDFLIERDTLNSFENMTSLLFKAKIVKGKFYTLKNWAMPIQYICKENQLIFYRNDNSRCEVCFDHNKKFVSFQDSVFEIDKKLIKEESKQNDTDNVLSLPNYPLPNFKYFYKKTFFLKGSSN